MYSVFEQLLQKYGISTYKISKDTGIAQSVFSSWKRGISTPKQDKLQIIADYFGVTIEYLMTGKEESKKKETKLTPKDERDIEKKLSETLDQIVNGDGLMFNGEIMDERTRQLLEISLRNTMESAKIAAKKFTPNKYKE